ncbi:MAG TPA: glycosyltransferase family 87 protein [Phototrophicaceae bacterium]|nr:glycosyltransferase family 87 protein [Phototrophicaceae bacterium]
MFNQLHYIRQYQAESKWYNRLLMGALIYAALRFVMQIVLLLGLMTPSETLSATPSLPDDLRLYLEAIDHLQRHENLYPPIPLEHMELYQYPPAYALVLTPLVWFPPMVVAGVSTVVHVAIYVLLYLLWGRIFQRLKLESANVMLAKTLPIWLVFGTFWSDLAYLNVYILMALLGSLIIDAILANKLGWAVLWFTIAIHTKPQWVLLGALPLLLGQPRFFIRLMALSLGLYAAIVGVTILLVGPPYGMEQYQAYFQLLASMGSGHFPWRGPEMPFLGYNHSILQILIYLFGESASTLTLALAVKIMLLIPLGVIGLHCLRKPLKFTAQNGLDAAFALYLAAFIWLDIVWELALGIVIFTYLLATLKGRKTKFVVWLVFLPYALVDMMQLISYLALGEEVITPESYVLTDISIYLPVVMVTTVIFYLFVIRRLWPIAFGSSDVEATGYTSVFTQHT